jgi:hypothetical protein
LVYNRRRGTAIVEFSEGILVVSQGSEYFMLAGGGAHKGERVEVRLLCGSFRKKRV